MGYSLVIKETATELRKSGGGLTWVRSTATKSGPPEGGPSQPTIMMMLPKRFSGTQNDRQKNSAFDALASWYISGLRLPTLVFCESGVG